MQPEPPHLLVAIAVAGSLILLLWPLAKASGKARGARLRSLGENLREGRPRGFLVLLVVAALLLATSIEHSNRQP